MYSSFYAGETSLYQEIARYNDISVSLRGMESILPRVTEFEVQTALRSETILLGGYYIIVMLIPPLCVICV